MTKESRPILDTSSAFKNASMTLALSRWRRSGRLSIWPGGTRSLTQSAALDSAPRSRSAALNSGSRSSSSISTTRIARERDRITSTWLSMVDDSGERPLSTASRSATLRSRGSIKTSAVAVKRGVSWKTISSTSDMTMAALPTRTQMRRRRICKISAMSISTSPPAGPPPPTECGSAASQLAGILRDASADAEGTPGDRFRRRLRGTGREDTRSAWIRKISAMSISPSLSRGGSRPPPRIESGLAASEAERGCLTSANGDPRAGTERRALGDSCGNPGSRHPSHGRRICSASGGGRCGSAGTSAQAWRSANGPRDLLL